MAKKQKALSKKDKAMIKKMLITAYAHNPSINPTMIVMNLCSALELLESVAAGHCGNGVVSTKGS